MTVTATPEPAAPPAPAETESLKALRARLHAVLPGGIPSDLDTPLNLLRWLRGHSSNYEVIIQHFRDYVSSREAAGFIGADLPEKFFTRPDIAQYLSYIGNFCLLDSIWSEENNAFLIVERVWSQPKEFIKTLKTSDFLMYCFGFNEVLLQLILKREKLQPLSKGPVQFIVIFDLAQMNAADYINASSGYLKLWQLRAEMWQNWYPEIVQCVHVVNPPRMVNMLYKLARLFINDRNARIINVLGSSSENGYKELVRQLPSHILPAEYGGQFINPTMFGDASGVAYRKRITGVDIYKSLLHYKQRGVVRARPSHKDLIPHEVFRISIAVLSGQSLCWDFLSSGELDFHIYTHSDEFDMVFPKLRLATPKLPEEGALDALPAGEYVLQFSNPHPQFTVKLDYSITLVGEGEIDEDDEETEYYENSGSETIFEDSN